MAIIGQLVQHLPKAISAGKSGAEYLYAVATGTAIGIGSNPEIRSAYELWKGKKKLSYDDKAALRRLGKEPVLDFETDYTKQEALRPGEHSYGNRRNGKYSFFNRRRQYRGRRRRRRSSRRCYCKSYIPRMVGSRRKYYT